MFVTGEKSVVHRVSYIVLSSSPSRRPVARHSEENFGAAAIELTADNLREIESAASEITVHGARYPEHLEKLVGRRAAHPRALSGHCSKDHFRG
jgi:hypothetical protein